MTYVIAQPCVDVKDKACIEECPVDDLGSPGGAARLGATDHDHPFVAGQPVARTA